MEDKDGRVTQGIKKPLQTIPYTPYNVKHALTRYLFAVEEASGWEVLIYAPYDGIAIGSKILRHCRSIQHEEINKV